MHRPPARFGHSLVFDEARGVTVLFGGVTDSAEEFGGTWVWDGTDWQEMALAGPEPRWVAGMTYDSQRQVVVLYGGDVKGGQLEDTWVWDDQTWTQQPVGGPGRRSGVALAYDSTRGVTVLFGGERPLNISGTPGSGAAAGTGSSSARTAAQPPAAAWARHTFRSCSRR